MTEHDKNNDKGNDRERERFKPLGELRPVDQPTEILTATTDDAGRVTVGDVGVTAREITEHEENNKQ